MIGSFGAIFFILGGLLAVQQYMKNKHKYKHPTKKELKAVDRYEKLNK
jgi:hypothetical protein